MSSDWAEVLLGDIVSFKTGKLDSNASEGNGQFPFFTCSPTTLAINSYAFDTEAVILAGNNANGVFATKYYAGKFNAYQRTYVIEPIDKQAISCRYIYFVICHMVGHLKELSVGSATKFLTKTILNALPIRIPPKVEQDEISLLLSALDDRITLLRETNVSLGAIAQASFKSWFVDFEPVHSKMQGRVPQGMDEATAAVFPDSFQETEQGVVPRGWYGSTMGTLCELSKGCSYKGNGLSEAEGAYMFNLGCFNEQRIFAVDRVKRYKGEYKPRHSVIPGDLIIANTDMTQDRDILGRPLLVPDGFEPSFISHHVFKVTVRPSLGYNTEALRNFLFFTFKEPTFRQRAIGFATGTTVLSLPASAVTDCTVFVPDIAALNAWNNVVGPLFKAIGLNEMRMAHLTDVRDTLLPRLISGKLRMSRLPAHAEAAVA